MKEKITFSQRLKEYRKSKRYTQGEFAKKLGLSQQTISNWENGNNATIDGLIELSKKCNISVDWFLGLSEYKNANEYRDAIIKEETELKVPDKLTYGYMINLIEKLYNLEYIKAFPANGRDEFDDMDPAIIILQDSILRLSIYKLFHHRQFNDKDSYNVTLDKLLLTIGNEEILNVNNSCNLPLLQDILSEKIQLMEIDMKKLYDEIREFQEQKELDGEEE